MACIRTFGAEVLHHDRFHRRKSPKSALSNHRGSEFGEQSTSNRRPESPIGGGGGRAMDLRAW
ncbi:hypothetical protein P152DRAFT_458415 [Eremomyces bilateralis CBS 781.70]|uniref:Uncharacterized protein n=1 Tax=Eremomyces bilateralis CBS 781.70 TaxID=1392243 RepID=A0A6G1G3U9_9PEZI|nr:uncharacterized protein P152DRAFT_458415 [Eremomyces bilateralis CBS 781.70]KAF1812590.1 hypothetical protein P152DRAFT_458415 [Eremomyces bilateralis CBS 781.70]